MAGQGAHVRRRAGAFLGMAGCSAVLLLGCATTATTDAPSQSMPASPPGSTAAQTDPAVPTPLAKATIASGLDAPWSVAFLPDGSALVSERDTARILRLTARPDGTWDRAEVGRVNGVRAEGEGGLLGLAVVPAAASDGQVNVLAYWSTPTDNRVGVLRWDGARLGQPEVILDGIPHAAIHNGGRLLAAPDGTVFVATGDAGDGERAPDPDDLAGKILRINVDGTVPADNPNPGSAVYSSGHRNVQGLALDAEGRLWASEFGASDVDELNLIQPGANYGWPRFEGAGGDPAFVDPAAQWSPTSLASPSGLAIAQGSAWVAGLRGRTLWQVPLSGESAGQPIARFEGDYGRLRDVVAAPDGRLWLVTSNTDGRGEPGADDDRIVQVTIAGT